MVYYEDNYLMHHGILGQKWGKKNGPPYPLKASKHSASEKKAGWRKSLKKDEEQERTDRLEVKSKNAANKVLKRSGNRKIDFDNTFVSKNTGDIRKALNLSDNGYEKAKKIAKIAGIGLATGAGLFLLGCALDGPDGSELLSKPIEDLSNTDVTHALSAINHDKEHASTAFDLDDGLFANPYNGDYVGEKARGAGFDEIDSDFLKASITDKTVVPDDFYKLLPENVRSSYIDNDGDRRLSCWSASCAYYLSVLTGKEFTAKNFQNAVDFEKFGKLFTEPPTIYDVFGNTTKTFVGPFGEHGTRATSDMAHTLAESILRNVNELNNLSPDGKRTVGFINAAYHGGNLPHQLNFEIAHDKRNGIETLLITDGFGGDQYTVARLLPNGKIEPAEFMYMFESEIKAYNKESLRFYAPALDSVETETMANVVLGKS